MSDLVAVLCGVPDDKRRAAPPGPVTAAGGFGAMLASALQGSAELASGALPPDGEGALAGAALPEMPAAEGSVSQEAAVQEAADSGPDSLPQPAAGGGSAAEPLRLGLAGELGALAELPSLAGQSVRSPGSTTPAPEIAATAPASVELPAARADHPARALQAPAAQALPQAALDAGVLPARFAAPGEGAWLPGMASGQERGPSAPSGPVADPPLRVEQAQPSPPHAGKDSALPLSATPLPPRMAARALPLPSRGMAPTAPGLAAMGRAAQLGGARPAGPAMAGASRSGAGDPSGGGKSPASLEALAPAAARTPATAAQAALAPPRPGLVGPSFSDWKEARASSSQAASPVRPAESQSPRVEPTPAGAWQERVRGEYLGQPAADGRRSDAAIPASERRAAAPLAEQGNRSASGGPGTPIEETTRSARSPLPLKESEQLARSPERSGELARSPEGNETLERSPASREELARSPEGSETLKRQPASSEELPRSPEGSETLERPPSSREALARSSRGNETLEPSPESGEVLARSPEGSETLERSSEGNEPLARATEADGSPDRSGPAIPAEAGESEAGAAVDAPDGSAEPIEAMVAESGEKAAPAPGSRSARPRRESSPAADAAAKTGAEAAPSRVPRAGRARPVGELMERLGRESEAASRRLSVLRLPQHTIRLIEGLRRDGSRFYRASLELDPPELGRLRIELRMEKDELSARFIVESGAAREQVQAELPRLKAALGRQEISDARIEVLVEHGGTQGGHDPKAQEEADSPAAAQRAAAAEAPQIRISLHEGIIDTRA